MTPKRLVLSISAVSPVWAPPPPPPRPSLAEERAEGLVFAARFSRAHRNGDAIASQEAIEHLMRRGRARRVRPCDSLARQEGDWD